MRYITATSQKKMTLEELKEYREELEDEISAIQIEKGYVDIIISEKEEEDDRKYAL